MNTILPIILIVLLAVAVYMIERRWRAKKVNRIFGDRPDLPLENLYAEFYEDEGIEESIVREAHEFIAEKYRIPAGKLRPTDQFGEELFKSLWPIDDALSEVSDYLAFRAKQSKLQWQPEEIKTLHDYIVLLSKAGSQKVAM